MTLNPVDQTCDLLKWLYNYRMLLETSSADITSYS